MKRMLSVWISAVVSVSAPAIGNAQTPEPASVRTEALLYRCGAKSHRACYSTTLSVRSPDAQAVLRSDSPTVARSWRARFLGDTALVGYARRARRGLVDSVRLLVLVDVSGSMKGPRFTTTKLILREFLDSLALLPKGMIRVGVAAFASQGVREGIRATRFTTPDSALSELTNLPTPNRGNTGLYSAVATGVEVVAGQLRGLPQGTLGGLIVVTDGDNDVRPSEGDDRDLLSGPNGLAEAVNRVSKSGLNLWLVGIGKLDRPKLIDLAGPRGRLYLVGEDADSYKFSQHFADIRNALWNVWEVTFPFTTVTREESGQGWDALDLQLARPGGQAVEIGSADWQPPFIALPAFAGVIDPGQVPRVVLSDTGGTDRRIPIGLFATVLGLLLWFVVPRLVWPPISAVEAVDPAEEPAKPAKPKPVAVAGGIRTDVKEVGPRRPTDTTAAKARRV